MLGFRGPENLICCGSMRCKRKVKQPSMMASRWSADHRGRLSYRDLYHLEAWNCVSPSPLPGTGRSDRWFETMTSYKHLLSLTIRWARSRKAQSTYLRYWIVFTGTSSVLNGDPKLHSAGITNLRAKLSSRTLIAHEKRGSRGCTPPDQKKVLMVQRHARVCSMLHRGTNRASDAAATPSSATPLNDHKPLRCDGGGCVCVRVERADNSCRLRPGWCLWADRREEQSSTLYHRWLSAAPAAASGARLGALQRCANGCRCPYRLPLLQQRGAPFLFAQEGIAQPRAASVHERRDSSVPKSSPEGRDGQTQLFSLHVPTVLCTLSVLPSPVPCRYCYIPHKRKK